MPPAPQLQAPWEMAGAGTNPAWAGPWGVSYTANLTPDAETGLGKWTVKDFKATIRTGRHMGRGRAILPPMPTRCTTTSPMPTWKRSTPTCAPSRP